MNRPRVVIRQAGFKDVSRVIKLQQKWFKEANAYGYQVDDESELKGRVGEFFLVAERGEDLVGFAVARVMKNDTLSIFEPEELFLQVDDVYIEKDARRLGLGRALLKELLKRAELRGVVRSLVFSSVKDLETVIRFYRDSGFKTWNVQMFR